MDDLENHSIPRSVFLHLAPGVANLSFTLIAFATIWNPSLPPNLIYGVLANVFVLIPLQLGYLFYLARKRGNSGISLQGVVSLNSSLRLRSYLFWVPVILVPTGIVFALFMPVTDALKDLTLFNMFREHQLADESPTFVFVLVLNIILTGILVPITEELYFRGYLLPRMPKEFGPTKPVAHTLLFAIYHFDTPWMIPVRTIGLLPLVYVALHTRSTKPGIIAHCLVNLADFTNLIFKPVRSA